MEGFGRQKQVLVLFWLLAHHATIVALLLNLLQTKETNPSGTQGIFTLIYSKAQNLTF